MRWYDNFGDRDIGVKFWAISFGECQRDLDTGGFSITLCQTAGLGLGLWLNGLCYWSRISPAPP